MEANKLVGYEKEFKFLSEIFEWNKTDARFEMTAECIDSIEIKPLDINVLEARHFSASSSGKIDKPIEHHFRHFYFVTLDRSGHLVPNRFSGSRSIGNELESYYPTYRPFRTLASKVRYIVNLNEYRLEGGPHHVEIVIYKAKGFDFEKALRLISF